MAADFSAAEKTFQESVRREFPYSKTHSVHFRPSAISDPRTLRLQGRVALVRPRYTLIEAEGYPTFLCPSSKSRSIQI